ncbi:MAG TPA: DUF1269 domain-containing protein [Gaiellaceae bacterium]|nr:DUF1269 domain-containing protein [Gaiellaceae bacterium]
MAETFVAVAFRTTAEAEQGLKTVEALDGVSVRDAAVVVRTEAGRIELHQAREISVGEGSVTAGSVGLVAGLLLGIPVAGALLGIVAGGGWGFRDTGIPDDRLRAMGETLEPGHAVLCVLVGEGLPRVREALAPYGDVVDAELEPAEP